MLHPIIGSPDAVLKPPASVFDEIASKLDHIKGLVLERLRETGLPTTAEEFHAFETFVHKRSCDFQNAVAGATLVALNEHPVFRTAAKAAFEGDHRFRNAGTRQTSVRLLGGGTVSLRTPYLARNLRKRRGRKRKPGRRGKGGSGVYPVLLCLGIQWAATSALASEVARQSAECGSYDCAQGNLAARGIDLDIKTVRRLTMALGKKGLQVREARIEQARDGQTSDEFKGKVIVVSADGGRLRVRIPKLRGRRRAETGRRGYECDWREPKCFVIYEVDSKGRKKRKSRPIYDATLGNADGVFEIMLAELKLRGASEAKKLIFLADGADWFWNRIPTLLNELGIEPRRVVRAVDYYHACEHLHEIVELRKGWNKRKRKAWAARMRKLLYAGKVDKVITALEHLCRGPNAKKIRTEMDYFVKRKEMMNYRQLRRRRLPIGSGSVESAVRRIVNLRLKGSGIFWLEKYAERMLYIRAQAKAGRWDEMVHAILSDLPLAA